MNPEIQEFTRGRIKEMLAKCPEGWQHRFKQMYANGKLETPINDVVDQMPPEKLDWALQQMQNSLKTLEKQAQTGEAHT